MNNYNDVNNTQCENCGMTDINEDLRCSCVTMGVCQGLRYFDCDWDYGNPNLYAKFPLSLRRIRYIINALITKRKGLESKIEDMKELVSSTGNSEIILNNLKEILNSIEIQDTTEEQDNNNGGEQQTTPVQVNASVQNGILYVSGNVNNGMLTV